MCGNKQEELDNGMCEGCARSEERMRAKDRGF